VAAFLIYATVAICLQGLLITPLRRDRRSFIRRQHFMRTRCKRTADGWAGRKSNRSRPRERSPAIVQCLPVKMSCEDIRPRSAISFLVTAKTSSFPKYRRSICETRQGRRGHEKILDYVVFAASHEAGRRPDFAPPATIILGPRDSAAERRMISVHSQR